MKTQAKKKVNKKSKSPIIKSNKKDLKPRKNIHKKTVTKNFQLTFIPIFLKSQHDCKQFAK